jgi:hypothetical protein
VSGALGDDVPDEGGPDSEVEPAVVDTDDASAAGGFGSGGAPFAVSGFAPYSFVA